MAIVIQAIYYIILLVIGIIFLPVWWFALILVFTLPFMGIAAYKIRILFVKAFARIRYTLKRKNSPEIREVLLLKDKIYKILDTILSKQ